LISYILLGTVAKHLLVILGAFVTLYCKYIAEYTSERILKIGQYLVKILSWCLIFCPSVIQHYWAMLWRYLY